MASDPLSEVLRLTEARSVVSGGVAAGGRWALHVPKTGQIVFSAILQGSCWLRIDGRKKAVLLEQGDVGLLPGSAGFVLCSSLAVRPRELELTDEWGSFETIGAGAGCSWLAGRVSLNPSSALLLTEALPPLIHVRGASAGAASLRWIVQELAAEQGATRLGASVASAQLAQLFFVKILREHLANAGALPTGWLRAVSDERLLRALRLLHDDPARHLTLDALAQAAGMSRTRFAVHFKAVCGTSPLSYLTAWRMRLAQRALRDGDASIGQVAESLGYTSESAFSHAFRRVTGTAPRSYRMAARKLALTATPVA